MAKVNNDYDELFDHWGRVFDVNPQLGKTIFHLESSGNPNIKEGAMTKYGRAQGPMQILKATADGLGITDPRDMNQAIPAAMKYIREGLDAGKTPEAAAAYYNGGPKSLQRWMPETQKYVQNARASYPQMTVKTDATGSDIRRQFMGETTDEPRARQSPGSSSPSGEDIRKAFLRGDDSTPSSDPAPAQQPLGAPDGMGGRFPVDNRKRLNPSEASQHMAEKTREGIDAAMTIPRAIGRGVAQGWGDQPLGASEQAMTSAGDIARAAGILPTDGRGGAVRAFNQNVLAPVVRGIVNPLSVAGDVGLRTLGAGYRGLAEGAMAAGVPRDIVAMPEAFMGGPGAFTGRAPVSGRRATPMAREASQEAPINPLAVATEAPRAPIDTPVGVPPGAEVPISVRFRQAIERADEGAASQPGFIPPARVVDPVTGAVTPVRNPLQTAAPETPLIAPRSVGAAASEPGAANMTARETQAGRTVAEREKLFEPQPTGRDPTLYIEGVNPRASHIEQSANVSREAKILESAIPEEAKILAKDHNEARQRHFAQIAGSDVDIANAETARAARAEIDLDATWKNKKDANTKPVFTVAQEIKSSPDGRRPVVRNAVDSVLKELVDGDGKPITDPEQLYGVRKHIDDLLSKEASRDNPMSVRAAAALSRIKEALDTKVIEPAAPGFREYLNNFSAASRPIDAMRILQSHEPRLYDTQGRMQLSRVQKMMNDIVLSRSAHGINPYKSIPDEMLARDGPLWALRDDLRRVASAEELARARGSDTAQNVLDMVKSAGTAGAHAAANIALPVGGSFVYNAIANKLSSKRMQRRMQNELQPKTQLNPLRSPE